MNPYTVSPYLRAFPLEPAGPWVDPGWRDRAACLGADPDLFFPEPDEDPSAAQAICAVCPVTAECLAYALAAPAHFGVFGGLAERERYGMRPGGPRLCTKGKHPLTPDNTYRGGGNRCRACRQASRPQPARKAVA